MALVLVGLTGLLSGCAAPSAFQLASYAADGVSYSMTDKSVTDHLISEVTAKDCALGRVLDGEDVCKDKAVEHYADGTPVPSAREVSKSIVPAENDQVFQNFVITNADPNDDEVMSDGGFNSDTTMVAIRPSATAMEIRGRESVASLEPVPSSTIDPQVRAHAAPVEPVYPDGPVAQPSETSSDRGPNDVGGDAILLEDVPLVQDGSRAFQPQDMSMEEDADEVLDLAKINSPDQNAPR